MRPSRGFLLKLAGAGTCLVAALGTPTSAYAGTFSGTMTVSVAPQPADDGNYAVGANFTVTHECAELPPSVDECHYLLALWVLPKSVACDVGGYGMFSAQP